MTQNFRIGKYDFASYTDRLGIRSDSDLIVAASEMSSKWVLGPPSPNRLDVGCLPSLLLLPRYCTLLAPTGNSVSCETLQGCSTLGVLLASRRNLWSHSGCRGSLFVSNLCDLNVTKVCSGPSELARRSGLTYL